MNYRSGILTGVVATLFAAGVAVAAWWLFAAKPGEAKSAPPPIPATVPKPFKEDQATALTLTAEAEQRLAIKTGTVERKDVSRRRHYGVEVVIPPGRSVIVSAALAGTLRAVPDIVPAAGLKVARGKPLMQLLPLLDPVGRANLLAVKTEAEGQVQGADETLKAAKIGLDAANGMLKGGTGTKRMVEDAEARVAIAQKALDAATARRNLLNKVVGEAEAGTTSPIPVEVPEDGVLRTVTALPGQTVPAGAVLFEVMNLSHVWVRVPVFVGDLSEIDAVKPAAVGGLTARPGDPSRPAAPVAAPPSGTPVAGTVDLFYEMDNRETNYRPGERVGAALTLKGEAASLTVPWSAVVFDYHGGSWVYEAAADHAYIRRRVTIRFVKDNLAVLDAGPPPGTKVVTAGAAELFGTEAGFSK